MRGKNLILALGLVAMVVPGAGRAHDGHGLATVVVDLRDRDFREGQTRITLIVSNYGAQPVVAMGIGLPGQDMQPLVRPLPVGPGETGTIPGLVLPVSAPDAFTVIVDFGPDGPLPVLVPAR